MGMPWFGRCHKGSEKVARPALQKLDGIAMKKIRQTFENPPVQNCPTVLEVSSERRSTEFQIPRQFLLVDAGCVFLQDECEFQIDFKSHLLQMCLFYTVLLSAAKK
jgi:hypothetical protein